MIIATAFILATGCSYKESKLPQPDICFQTEQDTFDITVSTGPGSALEYVVVHCDATGVNSTWGVPDLLRFFKIERGWDRPGYNLWIDREGRIWTLRKGNIDCLVTYEEAVYGVSGYNSRSYHIAYKGGVNSSGKSTDTRTEAQKVALKSIISIIKNACPDVQVVGHKHLNPNKACPSFNATSEYL